MRYLPEDGGDIAHVAEGRGHLVLGVLEAVARGKLPGAMGRDLPAMGGQVVDDDAALAQIEQVDRVEVETESPPTVADLSQALVGKRVRVGHVLGGHPAAGRAERGDVVEQP